MGANLYILFLIKKYFLNKMLFIVKITYKKHANVIFCHINNIYYMTRL
jgi:hypothetical protein